MEEQCQQQPHQGLIEDFIEMSEGLSESSDTCAVVFPREKKEEILPFITEEGSETKAREEPQKLILHLNPIDLDPNATAQPKNNPLPVYILPTSQFTPKAHAPKAESIPSALPVQYSKKLVAFV